MAQINQHLNTRKYLGALVGHARGIVMSCGQWRTPPPRSSVRCR
jgi:hypothetical protein